MKKNMNINIKTKFLVFSCIILIVLFLITVYFIPNNSQVLNNKTKVLNYSECKQDSIIASANCLRDFVAEFYNGTDTTHRLVPRKSLEELKQRGGTCYDYAFFYKEMAEDLGFETRRLSYDGIIGVFDPHTWTVIYDDNYHCHLDLDRPVRCYQND